MVNEFRRQSERPWTVDGAEKFISENIGKDEGILNSLGISLIRSRVLVETKPAQCQNPALFPVVWHQRTNATTE